MHFGVGAFYSTSITSIIIPEKTKGIGRQVFDNCLQLDRVIVPENTAWCQDTDNGAVFEVPAWGGNLTCSILSNLVGTGIDHCDPSAIDDDFNITEMCCHCGGGNSNGPSDMENSESLKNLVTSLCSNGNNQTCIDGNGTRAEKIVNHENNTCGLVCCEGSTCGTATTPPNDEEESSDETTLTTGAIIGIAVGSFVLLSTMAYVYHRQRKGTPSQPSSSTSLGYLVF